MRIAVKKIKTGKNTPSPPWFWHGLCTLDGGFSCSDKSYAPMGCKDVSLPTSYRKIGY